MSKNGIILILIRRNKFTIMKAKKLSVGIERHIDDLGRIVIPKEMRDKLNFEKNQIVNIKLFDDHIEIGKPKHRCLFCNTENDIKEYNNHFICESCLNDIVKNFSEEAIG